MLLEAEAEHRCEDLVGGGPEASEKSLDELVGSLVALTVDEPDEQLALPHGEFLQAWRILLLDTFLQVLDMLLAGFLSRERLQVFVCFDNG